MARPKKIVEEAVDVIVTDEEMEKEKKAEKKAIKEAKTRTRSKYPGFVDLTRPDMSIKVKCTFTQKTLGTAPGDEQIFSTYIASKAPDAETMAEEIAKFGAEDVEDSRTTKFIKDKDGRPLTVSYQWEGFFKTAGKVLKRAKLINVAAYKEIINTMFFVSANDDFYRMDRYIPIIMPEGTRIDLEQRSLRAETPQGSRIALASSEATPEGSYCEFYIHVMDSDLIPTILSWMGYGAVHGFGQWRNAGYGRFHTEVWDGTKYVSLAEYASNL